MGLVSWGSWRSLGRQSVDGGYVAYMDCGKESSFGSGSEENDCIVRGFESNLLGLDLDSCLDRCPVVL